MDELNQNPEKAKISLAPEVEIVTSTIPEIEYPVTIGNGEPLLRMVNSKFIREDKTISSDAYRPRRRGEGLESSVSTKPKSCLTDDSKPWPKYYYYEIESTIPNSRNYPCILNKECHVGITGDMEQLFRDEDSLEFFSENSRPLHL